MKIGIFTVTCNRLDLTKKYLPQLREKNNYEYDHLIIDNGSKDGTIGWAYDNGYPIAPLGENKGIVYAMIAAINHFKDCDLIIKVDNDCEILTDEIIGKIVSFYRTNGFKYVLAPLDIVIPDNYYPKVFSDEIINGVNFQSTTHVGGIFKCMPIEAANMITHDWNGDNIRGNRWRKAGYKIGYLTDLKIAHRGIENQTKNYKF